MKFYYFIVLAVFLASGCGSDKKSVVIKTKEDNKTTISKSNINDNTKKRDETKQDKADDAIARLIVDTNQTIEVLKTEIKTNMCHDNKIVILNIFAPWSKVSLAELEALDKLKQKHQDICVISIAIDSDSNTSLPNEYKISHKVIFGLQNNNFVDKIADTIHIDKNFKLPMSIIYKNKGYIDNYQGAMPFEMLDYIIKDK